MFDFLNEIDDINQVPQEFRGLYEEGQDGKHVLKSDDTVKSAVTAINGLNKALKASRAEAKAAKGKAIDLSELADWGGTPQKIKESVQAKIDELQAEIAKGGDAKLNLEKIKQDLAEAHSKDLKGKSAKIDALTNQIYTMLVESTATSAIAAEKGVTELLLPFIRNQVKVVEEDGKMIPYVVDGSGDRRFSRVTGEPMTIKELVAEMKGDAKYGRLFESDAHSGSHTPPGQQRTSAKPNDKPLTPTEKIAAGLNKGLATKGK